MLLSKIHHARVTDANVEYVGSITIDSALLERVDIVPYQEVHVWNVTNGERFTTYAMAGEPNSGVVVVNGSAARRVAIGDKIIVAAFGMTDEQNPPKQVLVDTANKFVSTL
jgi:aspartate 1-decarboxylase